HSRRTPGQSAQDPGRADLPGRDPATPASRVGCRVLEGGSGATTRDGWTLAKAIMEAAASEATGFAAAQPVLRSMPLAFARSLPPERVCDARAAAVAGRRHALLEIVIVAGQRTARELDAVLIGVGRLGHRRVHAADQCGGADQGREGE